MPASVREELLEALGKIDRPGAFCASGRVPPAIPGLEIAGVGPVALPLDKKRATDLRKVAHLAPYGKGTQTLLDTNVRRVWEIDAEQVTLANPEWLSVLKQVLGTVQSELGLEQQKLEAHLYKLLLYEKGSFFLPHRDAEKIDGMVATLVVALPSLHEGGELIVRHEGREVIVDFGPKSKFQTQFAAFYADCEHEIQPVTEGFRLTLVYNLTLTKSKRAITAPRSGDVIASLSQIIERWKNTGATAVSAEERSAPKLAVLLDHKYTEAGLTYSALKGIDRAKADMLFTAARQTGCDAYLSLVTFWESGSAEPSGDYGYGRRRRYYDDDGYEGDGEHEMGEVFDETLSANHFSDAEGNSLPIGSIPFDESEIVSDLQLNEGEPDKEDFEGYTGNAGMTLQRWYHRAAVVLWPVAARFDVLCEGGVQAAVGGLQQMVRQWQKAKKSDRAELKQSCIDFANGIISHWPERLSGHGYVGDNLYDAAYSDDEYLKDDEEFEDEDFEGEEDGFEGEQFEDDEEPGGVAKQSAERASFISLLQILGEASLIAAWLRGVLARDVSVDPVKTLGDICDQLGWAAFERDLIELLEHTSNETIERNARLLADWTLRRSKSTEREQFCAKAARQIIQGLERWDPASSKRDWNARKVNLSALLFSLAQTLVVLDEPQLFDRLTKYILDRPKEFDLTTVQVPTLLELQKWLKKNLKRAFPPLQHWLKAVMQELESRASNPPQAPADWKRESATGCSCADCKQLSKFLADPQCESVRLPMAERRRRHLHNIIDGRKLDTNHVTERRGSPYTLMGRHLAMIGSCRFGTDEVDLDQLAKIRKFVDWNNGPAGGKRTDIATAARRRRH